MLPLRFLLTEFLFLLLLFRVLTLLVNDDANEKKEYLTKFQVLSFSNEWLTALLTAVE